MVLPQNFACQNPNIHYYRMQLYLEADTAFKKLMKFTVIKTGTYPTCQASLEELLVVGMGTIKR